MIGGIYTDQKCCNGQRFIDNGKDGLVCPICGKRATRFRIQFKGLDKRFKQYDLAHATLASWRLKVKDNCFDKRDYRKDEPLGFMTLAEKWLERKKPKLKRLSYTAIQRHISRCADRFKNCNLKLINEADLEELETDLSTRYASKYVANIFSTLHEFLDWAKLIHLKRDPWTVPSFPELTVEMGYRKLVDKETQIKILDEVKRITAHNPKIYIGIMWLCTYPAIRPGELIQVREGDFDLGNKILRLYEHKTSRQKGFKTVPLLQEDCDNIRPMLSGQPFLHFFRHPKGIKGTPQDHPFSHSILYGWWKRACNNLGIEGVDLYGGTKHSTITDLGNFYTPEQISKSADITTNKAFSRYFQIDADKKRELFAKARRTDVVLTLNLDPSKKSHPESNQ